MSPFIRRSVTGGKPWEPKLCFKWDSNCWGHYPFTLKPFSLCLYVSLYMCAYMCVHACMCVCASFPCLESPRSLRELWKINTLRQLCLFIHLITHYHCITVPLISHHRAQIDTFVLFYHTGVWCNQLNLHLTPDTCIKWTLSMNMGASTTLQYEKEESKCTACVWEEESVCVLRLLDHLMASCAAILEVGVEQE